MTVNERLVRENTQLKLVLYHAQVRLRQCLELTVARGELEQELAKILEAVENTLNTPLSVEAPFKEVGRGQEAED